MAIGIQTDSTKIKPQGSGPYKAFIRKITLGGTVTAGSPVTLQSDGKWDDSDASAAQLTVGIAVQGGADTEGVDIVTYGPINNITGGTPGALVYTSDTAGELSETAGTKSTIIGYVETATILFVCPQIVDLS